MTDTPDERTSRTTTRRHVLKTLGAAAGTVTWWGCGSSEEPQGDGSGSSSDGGSTGSSTSTSTDGGGATTTTGASADGSGTSTSAAVDSSSGESSEGSSTTGAACGVDEGWLTGGTASMCGGYPDPFTRGLGNACELTCSMILGPCYDTTFDRQDISEGANGLPVRLSFLVVDESCTPVPGATVDVWHTSADGFYSGKTAAPSCTLGDPEALAGQWFRGFQTTNGDGRVDFDTCFPGWYGGRTIHIHVQVRVGDTEYVTTQLFFEDALSDEIIGGEPIYSDRGPRDTTNGTDFSFPEDDPEPYVFETERMEDGAMLAWKALVIRSSVADPLCAAG